MTPAEHYAEAELLLKAVDGYSRDGWDSYADYAAYRSNELAEAQIHATLALHRAQTVITRGRTTITTAEGFTS